MYTNKPIAPSTISTLSSNVVIPQSALRNPQLS